MTSTYRRRCRQALLLLCAVVLTASLAGAARFIWFDVAYAVMESQSQRLMTLVGSIAFLAGGGLFAALLSWLAHGHVSDAPKKRGRRNLVDAALGNLVAGVPGAWVLHVTIWDLAQTAVTLFLLVGVGTVLFWMAFSFDDTLCRRATPKPEADRIGGSPA